MKKILILFSLLFACSLSYGQKEGGVVAGDTLFATVSPATDECCGNLCVASIDVTKYCEIGAALVVTNAQGLAQEVISYTLQFPDGTVMTYTGNELPTYLGEGEYTITTYETEGTGCAPSPLDFLLECCDICPEEYVVGYADGNLFAYIEEGGVRYPIGGIASTDDFNNVVISLVDGEAAIELSDMGTVCFIPLTPCGTECAKMCLTFDPCQCPIAGCDETINTCELPPLAATGAGQLPIEFFEWTNPTPTVGDISTIVIGGITYQAQLTGITESGASVTAATGYSLRNNPAIAAGHSGYYDQSNVAYYSPVGTNRTAFTYTISAITEDGCKFDPDVVGIDAEVSAFGETISYASDGSPFTVAESLGGSGYLITNSGGFTSIENTAPTQNGTPVLVSSGVSTMTVELGEEKPKLRGAFAFGILAHSCSEPITQITEKGEGKIGFAKSGEDFEPIECEQIEYPTIIDFSPIGGGTENIQDYGGLLEALEKFGWTSNEKCLITKEGAGDYTLFVE